MSCYAPEGTFYAFVNIKDTGMTSEELSTCLLEKCKVVTVPGTAFGAQGEGYIRLSFATSLEDIKEGIKRIKKGIERIN